MNILALDTAMSACSVALWRDGGVCARRLERMERGQSEALMPMVVEIMAGAGEDFSGIDLLAVTVGPGAFTGLRIGLAAARGMALAAGLPCLGATTLEVVAHGAAANGLNGRPLLVALDSKRDDVFAQAFAAGLSPLGPPRALPAGDLPALIGSAGSAVVAGDASAPAAAALAEAGIETEISSALGVPDAAVLAEIAYRRWRAGETAAMPSPLYLRPPDAAIPKGGGRRRR